MVAGPREIVEQVRRMVAGEGVIFADLFADDGVLEYPFAPPGQPRELVGRETIRRHFGRPGINRRQLFQMDRGGCRCARNHRSGGSDRGDRALRPIAGDRNALPVRSPRGDPGARRRDVSYRDYMDPIALARLLGRTSDLASALAE